MILVIRSLILFSVSAWSCSTPLCAQNPAPPAARTKQWTPPRAPDGRADLQGYWNNSTLTPLERPREFGAKLVLSEPEAAAFLNERKHDNDMDRRDGGADADVARAYNEAFYDRGSQLTEIAGAKRSSLIVDPPDGRIPPFTAEAKKRIDQERAESRRHSIDSPTDLSPQERCIYAGRAGPPMLPGMYNNNYQIVQTPFYVMIYVEEIHDMRVIRLDRRQHLSLDIRQWVGDSIGHWEGDTLVVDTTNFTDKTRFRGSGENLHMTERFTRVDPRTIVYRFTVDDPSTFTRAWTAESTLTATSDRLYEYACHEGNYAMVDMLRGARLKEKDESGVPKKP